MKQNKETNLAKIQPYSSKISIKEILTRKWFLIQQQPLLKQIFSTEGAVHDVIQKGEFTERHTRKSKIIAKAEEPD